MVDVKSEEKETQERFRTSQQIDCVCRWNQKLEVKVFGGQDPTPQMVNANEESRMASKL